MTDDGSAGVPAIEDLRDRLRQFVVSIPDGRVDADPETPQSLREVFDDATVVGLGESTHGVPELYRVKDTLLRFLVTELDVRSITFEASFAGMAACNRYVVSGEGTLDEILDGLYSHYRTESFESLIEWLRAFNSGRARDDRVAVYGIDASSAAAVSELRDFLAVVDPGYAEARSDYFDVARGARWTDDREVLSRARSLVEELRERFDDCSEEYAERTTPTKVELAGRYVRELESAVDMRRADLRGGKDEGFAVRDEAIADTLHWIRDRTEPDRLVVWAENVHLTYDADRARPLLGDRLRESFGDDYYVLASDFGKHAPPSEAEEPVRDRLEAELGEFDADEGALEPVITGSHGLEGPTDVSLHEALADFGAGQVLLDFERVETDPVLRRWLDESHLFHAGRPVPGEDPEKLVRCWTPSASMDGFAYVHEGSWSQPLDTE